MLAWCMWENYMVTGLAIFSRSEIAGTFNETWQVFNKNELQFEHPISGYPKILASCSC